METNTLDIIIIGGGIAGLYCAYKIKKSHPSKKILLLEANDHLGGRAGDVPFHGSSVEIGAGIGRVNKDKLLLKLLKELRIPYHEFLATSQYASTIHPVSNVKEQFLFLKREYKADQDNNKTFKQYAKPKLDDEYGSGTYARFIVCAGYTDYENEAAYDTLHHYGFDDNYTSWKGFGLSWNQLIEKLASIIGSRHIKISSYVTSIKEKLVGATILQEVHCKTGRGQVQGQVQGHSTHTYTCKHVVLATTIESVMKLLHNKELYQQIQGQHFLRIYGKFSKESNTIMKEKCQTVTIVPGPIHKIIPMNKEKGVYMIAYTDNKGAKTLEKYRRNTVKNRETLCRLLEIALDIPANTLILDDMVDFYWDVGTHYYKPLKPVFHSTFPNRKDFIYEAQHPSDHVRVVGEMISLKQGWVEGALESVEAIITENFITKN